MANTTNFGWETPDDTDLVKDGAAAIRTLGSAIDTSLADLEGGTTGQILAKNSDTDMDFIWVTNDVGDITEVVAGTGISGGGTSGSVTITNTVATEFDAKGDLVVGTGADTFDKLTVGANDTILVADSSTATGLKWAAPASGGSTYVGVAINNSTNLTIANETATAVLCGAEQYDTDGFHSTSTNTSRMTIPAGKAGKYQLTAQVKWTGDLTSFNWLQVNINGSAFSTNGVDNGIFALLKGATSDFFAGSITLDLAVSDYVEVLAYQSTGTSKTIGNFRASLDYLGA